MNTSDLKEDKGPIITIYGTKLWCQNNIFHRTTGPAQIYSSYSIWVVNGHQLKHGILFNHSIYSCFLNELVGSPIFDFLLYNTTDPITSKLA